MPLPLRHTPPALPPREIGGTDWTLTSEPHETGSYWFHLTGGMWVQNCVPIREAMLAAVKAGERRIVLDLRRAGYVDSSGLMTLVRVARRAQSAGGAFWLAGVSPELADELTVTHLDTLLLARPS